ncbi:UNVERIFIED_CONTAM: cytochrome [Sesamum radiatum]|uniref:Cytochrome n=1 Tax=Sesamum radiatum TaxID=300843 RepID=A0AAW2M277_SESRA
MTELLRNPHVMSKLKTEVRTVLGANKQIEESDISKLPYLQAVIKEAFRYHPPGPFITRVKDGNDLQFKKYVIPKDALILINIWATGRDPSIWPNPDLFEPERFWTRKLMSKATISNCSRLGPAGESAQGCRWLTGWCT